MKQTLFLFLFAFSVFKVNGQNWLPIMPNQKYHYVSDSIIGMNTITLPLLPSSNAVLNSFQYGIGGGIVENAFTVSIDSSILIGNSTHHKYKPRVIQCDTCANLAVKIIEATDPEFLYPEIIQLNTGGYLLILNQDTVELEATPQSTFITDPLQNISVVVDSIFLDTWLYGSISDSVASISVKSLTAPFISYYRILLSKNNGIVKLYDYDTLSQNPNLRFQMIGKEDANPSLGYKQLKFQNVYDFNVGDQFYYHEYIFDGNPLWSYPTNVLEYWYRLEVIGRQDVALDTIVYTFERVFYNQGYPALTLNVVDTLTKSYILAKDKPFTMQEGELREVSEYYFYGNAICKDFFATNAVKYIGYDLGLTNQQTGPPWTTDNYISAFQSVFLNPNLYEGIPSELDDVAILYSIGLGRAFEGHWHFEHTNITEMIGFIKGSTMVGSTPGIVILNQEKLQSQEIAFSIFPNPVTNVLKVNISNSTTDLTYRIFDAKGHEVSLVRDQNNSKGIIEISVQDLVKGVYFLEVQDNERTVGTKKFIKK